ncbi:MAG: outer membrane beta-barrel protein [Thermoanaerobaculia bacterium]
MRLCALVTTALLFASPALAQERLERGTRELSLHISPDFEGAVGDMLQMHAGYGLFVRTGWEARATLGYAVFEDVAGEDSDYRTSELSLVGEYHFRRGSDLVPYAGFGAGWRKTEFAELEESGAVFGPRGGLKYFLADNVVLDFEVTYKIGTADVFINDFEPDDTDISSMIGFRILF